MVLQSSIRTSLLLTKFGLCGWVRTFASARPGKLPTFAEVQQLRQEQAKRSLLVQVSSVKSSDLLGSYLEQYGTINSLYHYTMDKKEFLFVEMSSPMEVEAVLRCACHPRAAVVPVSSPLLWLRSGEPLQPAPATVPPQQSRPSPVPGTVLTPAALCQEIAECPTLDEQLLRHHELTRLTELGARLRYFTCELLERALSGLFPSARVRPFGSSANGFGRHDCDVDLVLELAPERTVQACYALNLPSRAQCGLLIETLRVPPPPLTMPMTLAHRGCGTPAVVADSVAGCLGHWQWYSVRSQASNRLAFQTLAANRDGRTQTQRYLNFLGDQLTSLMPGCSQVRRILKARVPIVKYTQSLTGVDCDLSMARNGMQMTELLYIWSQLDTRVAPLVRVIRHWAEQVHLTNCLSGSGRFISNFGITLLVIYFLQTRPVPLLPSVNELTQLARPGDTAQVDDATYTFLRDPSRAPTTTNTESLSDLLAAFFALYADLDLNAFALSLVWAGRFGHPGDAPLHVQNPLDLELNVTKNVSREEVCHLAREAGRAGRLLDEGRWWELLLGEGGMCQLLQTHAKSFSVRQLFEEEEEERGGATGAASPPVDAVKLGSVLGGVKAGRAGGGKTAAVGRRNASTPFSGLRLTVDGEIPGADRTAVSDTVSAVSAAAAAAASREQRAAEAAAAAREQRAAAEAMTLLDATSNKKPSKRKKKRKGYQAGRW